MTTEIWLRDIGAWWVQAGVVAGAGAALAWLLRIRAPRPALIYWRTLLVACLALPLCQPWTPGPAPTTTMKIAAVVFPSAPAIDPAPPPARALPSLERVAGVALVAGIALRTAWLLVGACGLRRLRRRALPLDPVPAAIRGAHERLDTGAALCISDSVAGPITFGLFRPVVVFPTTVRSMPPHVQEAIACHELLHVRRRDWIAGLLEEAIRTVLWFQPAIWWLIDRIQLTREQVVDCAAIELTESKERYVEALLTVARAKFTLALIPASPFLRRRLLKKRVAQILEESTMSTRHLVSSLGASAIAILFAAALAVRAFPLQAQSQSVGVNGGVVAPVQIVKGSEHLLHGDIPEYPLRAIEQKVEGDLLLELAIDDRGEVADARVLSGPDELRRNALRSVLQWHYGPPVRSTTVQVTLRYHVPEVSSVKLEEKRAYAWMVDGGEGAKLERQMEELKSAMASPDTTPQQKDEMKAQFADTRQRFDKLQLDRRGRTEGGYTVQLAPELENKLKLRAEREKESITEVAPETNQRVFLKLDPFADGPVRLARIRTERVNEGVAAEIVKKAGFSVGSLITAASIERIRKVARDTDEHLEVSFGRDENGGFVVTIVSRD